MGYVNLSTNRGAITVMCPTCGAFVGSRCRNKNAVAVPEGQYHVERCRAVPPTYRKVKNAAGRTT